MYKKILLFSFIAITFTKISFAGTIDCIFSDATNKEYSDSQSATDITKVKTYLDLLAWENTAKQFATGNASFGGEKCLVVNAAELYPDKITAGPSCAMTTEESDRCSRGGLTKPVEGHSQNTRPGGSLLGFSTLLNDAVKDPIPLNLAYYVDRNIQKIPVIRNTAFADTPTTYGGPFLAEIYTYWTVSRNIAYACMAMVMMIIGILIIMGKSIDPKAGVTIQQALPQVIIALILITFSYPIGAAGASLAFNIRGNMDRLAPSLLQVAPDIDFTAVAGFNWLSIVTGGGTGILALLWSIVSLLIAAVMGILVLLKIFGIYLKMLIATVTAPLTFSLGALPGNQGTTVNWFKQFGAYMVSIPGISFGAWVVFGLVADIGIKGTIASTSRVTYAGWGFGNYVSIIVLPLITFYGYTLVLKIPEKIDEMFGVGGKKR